MKYFAVFCNPYSKFAHILVTKKKYFAIFWNPSKFAHFLVTKNQAKMFEKFLPSTQQICPLFCHKKVKKTYLQFSILLSSNLPIFLAQKIKKKYFQIFFLRHFKSAHFFITKVKMKYSAIFCNPYPHFEKKPKVSVRGAHLWD